MYRRYMQISRKSQWIKWLRMDRKCHINTITTLPGLCVGVKRVCVLVCAERERYETKQFPLEVQSDAVEVKASSPSGANRSD